MPPGHTTAGLWVSHRLGELLRVVQWLERSGPSFRREVHVPDRPVTE